MILARRPSILIVGGGPVGLCTAIALLQSGHRVTLIDSGLKAAGWASGGMLAPLYEMSADQSCPDAFLHFALESARLWQDFARDCAIRLQSPTLFLARNTQEAETLESVARRADDLGQGISVVAVPHDLKACAAYHAPSDQVLEPRTALKSLLNRFRALGGDFVIGQVEAVGPHKLQLHTGTLLEGDVILLAHGFGAAGLAAQVPTLRALSSVKGQMLRVIHPELSGPVVRAGRIYLLSRGNSLVIGATSDPLAPHDLKVEIDPVLALLAEAKTLLPSLTNTPVVESWAGLRPDTPDHIPLLGSSGVEGVYLATGTYRNGWLLAPAIGTYFSQLISGKTPDKKLIDLFAPDRFSS